MNFLIAETQSLIQWFLFTEQELIFQTAGVNANFGKYKYLIEDWSLSGINIFHGHSVSNLKGK